MLFDKEYSRIDIDTFLFELLLVFASRLFSYFFEHPLVVLFGGLSSAAILLIAGFKIARISTQIMGVNGENRIPVETALTTIIGPTFIYSIWLSASTFTHHAQLITPIFTILMSLIPPKLELMSRLREYLKKADSGSGKIAHFLLILQATVIAIVTLYFAFNPISTWTITIFDGLSFLSIGGIIIVILLTVILLTRNNGSSIVSLFMSVTWLKSLTITRGLVTFGGDNGPNLIEIQFLLNGGKTSFAWIESWRSTSLASLFYQSNMAFINAVPNLDPSYASASLSVAFTSPILILSVYSLSQAIIRNHAKRYAISGITILAVPCQFWWQLTLTPNALAHCVSYSFVTLLLVLPRNRCGALLIGLGSIALFLCHPTMLMLVLPGTLYFAYGILKKGSKRIVLTLIAILASVGLTLIFFPKLGESFLEITHMNGFIGNQVSYPLVPTINPLKSKFIERFDNYVIPLIFIGIGVILFLRQRKNKNLTIHSKRLLGIASVFLLEIVIIDFFFELHPLVVGWRFWPVSLAFFALLVAPSYVRIAVEAVKHLSLRPTTFNRPNVLNAAIPILLTAMLTTSVVLGGYPEGQSLNMDTLTEEEYSLLENLISSVNLDSSIILTEYPTYRYLRGMVQKWYGNDVVFNLGYPDNPSQWSKVHKQRAHAAFVELAYYDSIGSIANMLHEIQLESAYFVVFYRYQGEKSKTWYNGSPYVANLRDKGDLFKKYEAGYVLKYSRSNFTEIPLDDWDIAWNYTEQSRIQSFDSGLFLEGNFTDRLQSIAAAVDVSEYNLTAEGGFYLHYNCSTKYSAPVMRVWLQLRNGTQFEVEPFISPSLNNRTYYYRLGSINQEIDKLIFSIDSGTSRLYWPGPGVYYYHLFNAYLAPW